jgi:hypothetical protein
LLALLPVSIGIVDWALFSGMEVATFAAALGRALEALNVCRLERRRGRTRESLQWRLGVWGAVLVLLRPEAGIVVAVFAIVAARGAGRRSGLLAVLRASLPGALATLAVLGLNQLATGDARSAGAQLKLLSSNPYMSDIDRARAFAENLVTFWMKVVRGELTYVPSLVLLLGAFVGLGLLRRDSRAVTAACVVSALGWTLIVSWNGNAPHHNFRYYVPALILLSIAAALGIGAIAKGHRHGVPLSALFGLLAIAASAPKVPGQIRHFRSASANIRDQHVEVGKRIARLPDDARVLDGDAGAIPYVSGRSAVDALGLGGYRGLPFAQAAVHGEPATIELIERLAPSARPTHLALYPNWFSSLTSRFGVEIDRVTIAGNVICGGPTKGIYLADWSTLDEPHSELAAKVVDELDTGDIIDERQHTYVPPLPHGGWTTLDVLADSVGQRRFDGGRTIPQGAHESFIVRRGARVPLRLRVRIDGAATGIVMRVHSRGTTTEKGLDLEPGREGVWRSATALLDAIDIDDEVVLEARGSEYRNYHVWIERESEVAPLSSY